MFLFWAAGKTLDGNALDISRNIPFTSLGEYNQMMHKYHE